MTITERLEFVRPVLKSEGHHVIDTNTLRRIKAAYKRNQADPGDSEGDDSLLFGLAVAEAFIGRCAGWIPEVQRIGCRIASWLDGERA
jgi:hypothetical protein